MVQFFKNNWKYLILILIILYLLPGQNNLYQSRNFSTLSSKSLLPVPGSGVAESLMAPSYDTAAPTDTQDRLVIRDTSLSLVVKNVSQSIAQIENKAAEFGGYIVDSYLSRPEEGGSGHISIRVPEEKRTEALVAFRGFAVKVVSESIFGNDVTDEFVDLESRLEVLNKTKAKFEDILARATAVADLLSVQRELINLQQQIDNIKGQQKYYQQSAKLTKITIYLSTDELSLPYAPTDTWRPAVIFKTAVRSLVGSLRQVGTAAIWLLVYSPIILIIVVVALWARKKYHKL